jgi:hypothetical protein
MSICLTEMGSDVFNWDPDCRKKAVPEFHEGCKALCGSTSSRAILRTTGVYFSSTSKPLEKKADLEKHWLRKLKQPLETA